MVLQIIRRHRQALPTTRLVIHLDGGFLPGRHHLQGGHVLGQEDLHHQGGLDLTEEGQFLTVTELALGATGLHQGGVDLHLGLGPSLLGTEGHTPETEGLAPDVGGHIPRAEGLDLTEGHVPGGLGLITERQLGAVLGRIGADLGLVIIAGVEIPATGAMTATSLTTQHTQPAIIWRIR